jgi:hypothetical protein
VKILYQPDITVWTYKCTCGVCTSKLEASYEDLRYRIDRKYYGGGYGDEGYYANTDHFYVNCPICTKEVTVHAGDIPYLLKEHAKKVSNESTQKSRHK